jgi:hypothetical protein
MYKLPSNETRTKYPHGNPILLTTETVERSSSINNGILSNRSANVLVLVDELHPDAIASSIFVRPNARPYCLPRYSCPSTIFLILLIARVCGKSVGENRIHSRHRRIGQEKSALGENRIHSRHKDASGKSDSHVIIYNCQQIAFRFHHINTRNNFAGQI